MPTYTNTKVSFIQHTAEDMALIRPLSCVSGSCSLSTTNLNAIISAEESEFLACLNNYGDGMTLFLTTGANEFDLDNSHTYTLKVKCSDAADFRSVGGITIPAQAFMQGSSVIKFSPNDILILHKIGSNFTICNYHLISNDPVLSTTDHSSTVKYLVHGSNYTGTASKYLKEDGSWATPTNTTYAQLTSSAHATNKTYSIQGSGYSGTASKFLREDGTWQTVSSGSTYTNLSASNHNSDAQYTVAGIGATTNENSYLRSDGSWTTPTNTTYEQLTSSAHAENGNYVVKGIGTSTNSTYYLRSDGSWTKPENTTYAQLTSSAHATNKTYSIQGSGYSGTASKFLREDGTWQTAPSGTTYATLATNNHASGTSYVVKGVGTVTGWYNKYLKGNGDWGGTFRTDADGLVPQSGTSTNMYLKGNGTWATPTNTTYGTFTTAANGLVPKPTSSTATTNYVLSGNGTWVTVSGGSAAQAVGRYPGNNGSLGTVIPATQNSYAFPSFPQADFGGSEPMEGVVFPNSSQLYALPVEISTDGVIYVPISQELKKHLVEDIGGFSVQI